MSQLTTVVPVSDYAPKPRGRRHNGGEVPLRNVATAAADVIAVAAAETRAVAERIAETGTAAPVAQAMMAQDAQDMMEQDVEAAEAPAEDDQTLRLASCTIAAVDQIGEQSAAQIEKTADAIIAGATEVATNLRQLAAAMRGHSKTAHEHVSGFCAKATSVLTTVRDLQCQLTASNLDAAVP